jgi:hypothetical protein
MNRIKNSDRRNKEQLLSKLVGVNLNALTLGHYDKAVN